MRKTLAAISAGILASLSITAPALAAGPCSSDSLCFYDTSSSPTAFINHDDADNTPGQCWVMGINDRFKASYVKNQTDAKWWWYGSTNCQGGGGPLYANTYGSIASNQAASYYRIG